MPFCERIEGCCTELSKIILLSNQELQDLYSDRATVVRLLGDLWFYPNNGSISSIPDLLGWEAYVSQAQCFLGLRSGEISSQDQTATFDIWDQAHDDLSEGRWRKTWQHLFTLTPQFMAGVNQDSSFDLNLPVGDTHTTGSTIPGAKACSSLASGSGQICIDTDIECEACPQGITAGQIQFSSTGGRHPGPWHVHLDVRKRFPMRENQELYLMFNARHYATSAPTNVEEGFWSIYGNVRILTEMG